MIEKLGAPGGVEPPTNGLGNRCSIQLSYGATCRKVLKLLQFTATDSSEEVSSVAHSLPNCGTAPCSFSLDLGKAPISTYRALVISPLHSLTQAGATQFSMSVNACGC